MSENALFSLPTVGRDGGKVRVACVGDSITEGYGSSDPATKAYPAVLQTLLGDGYEVTNYGIGGSTLMRCSDMPYREKWGYLDSIADKPDLVFLMMGTNDANRDFNIRRLAGFYTDFVSMINEYRQVGATVVVMTSPELFCNVNNQHLRQVVAWQKEAARLAECPVIDVNEFSHTRPYFFPDRVHGDNSGYAALAYFIWQTAFGGTLYQVEVQTVPRATVTLGSVRVPADDDGIARFEVPAGVVTAHGYHIGYHSNKMEVLVDGDLSFELPLESGGRELAHGCPAIASSHEGINPPEKVTDGQEVTRWASLDGDDQWITVDLGQVYNLVGVCLRWETAYGKVYDIEVSEDGETFTVAATKADGTGDVEELELAAGSRGRYVRMHGHQRGTIYAYSLYDFLVFGE